MSISKNSQTATVIFDPSSVLQIPDQQIIKTFQLLAQAFENIEIKIVSKNKISGNEEKEELKKIMLNFKNKNDYRSEDEIQQILKDEGLIS